MSIEIGSLVLVVVAGKWLTGSAASWDVGGVWI
jgi:hypothetical protein